MTMAMRLKHTKHSILILVNTHTNDDGYATKRHKTLNIIEKNELSGHLASHSRPDTKQEKQNMFSVRHFACFDPGLIQVDKAVFNVTHLSGGALGLEWFVTQRLEGWGGEAGEGAGLSFFQ
jgi:hypothetical protein